MQLMFYHCIICQQLVNVSHILDCRCMQHGGKADLCAVMMTTHDYKAKSIKHNFKVSVVCFFHCNTIACMIKLAQLRLMSS